jgi:hypothetical protein
MKFRPLRFIAWMSCFALINVAVQINSYAWADSSLFGTEENSNTQVQRPVGNSFEGIDFITLTPNQPILVPKEGEMVTIKIGIRITNNSLESKKFTPYRIIPGFINEDKQVINPQACITSIRDAVNLEPHFELLKSGNNIDFLNQVELYWARGKLVVESRGFDGAVCSFTDFKPGNYSVFAKYEVSPESWLFIVDQKDRKDAWIGKVQASPSSLNLVENP